MQSEDAVPPDTRYLLIASKMSAQQIEHLDTVTVPSTVDRCRQRLDAESLRTADGYLNRGVQTTQVHLIVIAAYADLPLNKEFGILFHLDRHWQPDGSQEHEETHAILRHVIFWGLPVNGAQHGHGQICVFEFPRSVPRLIESVGIDKDDGCSSPQVGLCGTESWESICRRRCAKP